MPKVNMSTELPVPAQTVWDAIGNFNALAQWHPAVAQCEESKQGGATIRKLTLHGGGTIVERLEKKDDSEQSYSYSILEGPLPVSGYTSKIRVSRSKAGSSCTVEWSSEFEAAGVPENEATKVIRGIYEAGLQNLQKMYGK